MSRWQYFVASAEKGMIAWASPEGGDHRQALQGGLDYLGSQGWELTSVLPKDSLGTTVSQTLIFKRPTTT